MWLFGVCGWMCFDFLCVVRGWWVWCFSLTSFRDGTWVFLVGLGWGSGLNGLGLGLGFGSGCGWVLWVWEVLCLSCGWVVGCVVGWMLFGDVRGFCVFCVWVG